MEKINKKILHFVVIDSHCCVDLKNVVKVLPLVNLEKIPGCPDYFCGVMNLSGDSIPVIDLGVYLGLKRQQTYSLEMPILLCEYDSHVCGLIVDAIVGLESISIDDEIQEASAFPIRGTWVTEAGVYLALNLDCILKTVYTLPVFRDKVTEGNELEACPLDE